MKILAFLALYILCVSLSLATPIRITVIDTQSAVTQCLPHLSPAQLTVSLIAPTAACAVRTEGACTIYAPVTMGPGTLLGLAGFESPDGILGHELIHCLEGPHRNFHDGPAKLWSER